MSEKINAENLSNAEIRIKMKTLENEVINISGRHDPAIIRRICIVIKAMTALKRVDTEWGV